MFSLNQNSKRLFKKRLVELRPEIYKIAWSWCHDTQLADDLVQQSLEKALKKRKQLKDINKLKPWLARILVHLHTDHLRKQKEYISFDENALDEDQNQILVDPSEIASRDESVQLVRLAISRLNEKHRKIISLVDIAEFSYSEVSESLDLPMGTVMSRLSRARENLKGLLYDIENPKKDLSKTGSSDHSVSYLKRVK